MFKLPSRRFTLRETDHLSEDRKCSFGNFGFVLVNSMPTGGVDDNGHVAQVNPVSMSLGVEASLTAEKLNIPLYEYDDTGEMDKKPLMNTTRLQFYLELERPHVLIVTDMSNRSSSVLKVGCNLRMTYIASIKDQNLDVSLLQTDMSCVPFKYSFGTAEMAQAGITVLNGRGAIFYN